jgi:Amt family ammonium transporter
MQLCNGVLCGLVAVTPGCGLIDPWAAIIVAVLGSAAFLGLDLLMLRLLLDDVVAAAPMHLGCGVVGTLFVGFFARESYVKEFYGVNPAGDSPLLGATHRLTQTPPHNLYVESCVDRMSTAHVGRKP